MRWPRSNVFTTTLEKSGPTGGVGCCWAMAGAERPTMAAVTRLALNLVIAFPSRTRPIVNLIAGQITSLTSPLFLEKSPMHLHHRRLIMGERTAQCPLMVQSGHHATEFQCPLSGVKRTSARHFAVMQNG